MVQHSTLPFHGTEWHRMPILRRSGQVTHNSYMITEILKELERLLTPGQKSLSWKISTNNWPSMSILYSHMPHGTMHHPNKFKADIWNPSRVRVVTSFGTDRQTDRQTDGWTDGCNDWQQYLLALRTDEGKITNHYLTLGFHSLRIWCITVASPAVIDPMHVLKQIWNKLRYIFAKSLSTQPEDVYFAPRNA